MAEPDAIRTPLLASSKSGVTRRRLLYVAGVAALGPGMAGPVLGSDDDDDDDGDHYDDDYHDRDDDDIRPAGTGPPGSAEVVIDDDDADGFEPGIITIDRGQTVTWVNLDDDPHTVTGAGFDTGILQPGDLATIIFDEPGVFPYSCQIHPIMTGTVEVRDESGMVPVDSSADDTATPNASPAATARAAGMAPAEVEIDNLAFSPAELTVVAGMTVIWTNQESIPHTVRSTTGEFDSGIMERGDTFEHTFDQVGVFDYICGLHPSMEGRITVEG